ncbi:MAG: FAD-binding protein, partial [Myxococcota bacterium]
MAASLVASEVGADVPLLDRDDEPGAGLLTGGQAFAVGTRWQEAVGIVDTVDLARADWATITAADPDAPGVLDFLANSAETLEWLTGYGLAVSGVRDDRDAGELPRLHALDWSAIGDARGLYDAFGGVLRPGVEVTAPVLEDGAVVGVVWRDLATGEIGTTGAGAVVLATGGFVRDREEVDRLVPALEGRALVFEANYQSDGGGRPFLDAVGAARLAPEQIGIYVHSIRDPDLTEGESILVIAPGHGLLVDAAGERFVDEGLARSFDLFDALPAGDVYQVLAGSLTDTVTFQRPAYNWARFSEPETIPLEDLLAVSDDVFAGESLEDVALAAGIDVEGLQATVDAWNTTVEAGADDPLGRDMSTAVALEGGTWIVARLTPGLAKNFGGVSTDADGHVLGLDGAPIPGLFAAGEVAGMVIGGGGGDGFSGSVGACYWGGRV